MKMIIESPTITEKRTEISLLGVGPCDVLLGRSPKVYGAPGNQIFRDLINQHLNEYNKNATRAEKASLVLEILSMIHTTGGRFMRLSGSGQWVEVSTEVAKEKICHALRDARLLNNRNAISMIRRSSQFGKTKKLRKQFADSSACQWHIAKSCTEKMHSNPMDTIEHLHNDLFSSYDLSSYQAEIGTILAPEIILDCQIQQLLRLRRAILSQENFFNDAQANGQNTISPFCHRSSVPSLGHDWSSISYHREKPLVLPNGKAEIPCCEFDLMQPPKIEAGTSLGTFEQGNITDERSSQTDDITFETPTISPKEQQFGGHTIGPSSLRAEDSSSPCSRKIKIIQIKAPDHVAPWNALVPKGHSARIPAQDCMRNSTQQCSKSHPVFLEDHEGCSSSFDLSPHDEHTKDLLR